MTKQLSFFSLQLIVNSLQFLWMKKFILIAGLIIMGIGLSPVSHAADLDSVMVDYFDIEENIPTHLPGTQTEFEGGATDINKLIKSIADVMTYAVASIAILMIIYNGFRMVAAAGDSDAITSAKKGFIWSLVGLLGIIFAYVIVKTIIALSFTSSGEDSETSEAGSKETGYNIEEPLQNYAQV